VCVGILTYASFHSVWEIHYLKSFYPKSFTVTEAGYAATVELIKIALISFPLVIIIILCMILIMAVKKEKK
jgi:hypothetical protein